MYVRTVPKQAPVHLEDNTGGQHGYSSVFEEKNCFYANRPVPLAR